MAAPSLLAAFGGCDLYGRSTLAGGLGAAGEACLLVPKRNNIQLHTLRTTALHRSYACTPYLKHVRLQLTGSLYATASGGVDVVLASVSIDADITIIEPSITGSLMYTHNHLLYGYSFTPSCAAATLGLTSLKAHVHWTKRWWSWFEWKEDTKTLAETDGVYFGTGRQVRTAHCLLSVLSAVLAIKLCV